MAGNISLSDILHNRPAVVPTIYGYTLPDVADHNGYIKIGYTDREDTDTRIKEQLHTAAIPFRVLFKESAMRSDGTCFNYSFHNRNILFSIIEHKDIYMNLTFFCFITRNIYSCFLFYNPCQSS